MDAMDILGSLLGGKKSAGGSGGSILSDLLGGKRGKTTSSSRTGSSSRGGTSRGPSTQPVNVDRQAQELEDLLGVATERQSRSRSSSTQGVDRGSRYGSDSSTSELGRNTQQAPSRYERRQANDPGIAFDDRDPTPRNEPLSQDEEAVVLIRAMIQAAKSDGRISREEQQQITSRVTNPSAEAIQFLRQEFDRPVDVKEFTWSVPIGMEQKVYVMSLAAIDLDNSREADYLRQLAHGLRISSDVCNQLHQRYNVRPIF